MRTGRIARAAGFVMGVVMPLCMSLGMPLIAMADDSTGTKEGRIMQLQHDTLDTGNTSLTWLLFIGLLAIGTGVLFKHSRRTHLD